MAEDRTPGSDDLSTLVREMRQFSDATPVGPARIPAARRLRPAPRLDVGWRRALTHDASRAALVMAAVVAIVAVSILGIGSLVGGSGSAPIGRGAAEDSPAIPSTLVAPADWMAVSQTPGRAAAVLSAERGEGLARWTGGDSATGVVTVSASTGAYTFLPIDLPESLGGSNPPWRLSPDGRYLAHWYGGDANPTRVSGVQVLDLVTGAAMTFSPAGGLGITAGDLAWADTETLALSFGVVTRREGGTTSEPGFETSFDVAPVLLIDAATGQQRGQVQAAEPLPAELTSASSAEDRGLGVLQQGVLRLVDPDGTVTARGRLAERLAPREPLDPQHLGPVGRWAVSLDDPTYQPSQGSVLFERFPGSSGAASRGIAFPASPSDAPGVANEIIGWSTPTRVVVRGMAARQPDREPARPIVFDLPEAGGPSRILVDGEGLEVRATAAGRIAPQFADDLWLVPTADRPLPSSPLLTPERARWAVPVLAAALVVALLARRRVRRP